MVGASAQIEWDDRTVNGFADFLLRDNILHGAAMVRKAAQWSLKDSKGSSYEGEAPHSHTGRIKHMIAFAWDSSTRSAVIGPELSAGKASFGRVVPGILEHGGTAIVFRDRRTKRVLGGGGEIRIGGASGPTMKATTDNRGKVLLVVYAKLNTAAQVARANKINNELYAPVRREVTIGPRPFMEPALVKLGPKLEKLFA